MIYRFTLLLFFAGLLAGGCKKKNKPQEDTKPTPVLAPNEAPPPAVIINIPSDADGVFMASFIPYRFPDGTYTTLGNASSMIYNSPTNHSFADGGLIKVNDSIVSRLNGGSYYFTGKAISGQSISGVDFRDGSAWEIAGNPASGVPSFTHIFLGMPYATILSGTPNASRTHPYEAVFTNFPGADSMTVILSADSMAVKKTVVAGTPSVLFTTEEVAGVRKQHSYIQGSLTIIPYKMSSAIYNGKKYYFVNSNTSTFVVYIGA